MERTIIGNWNATVGDEDTVYILGDFIWKRRDEWASVFDSLSGKKVLIRGNHDPIQLPPEAEKRLQDICDYKEIKDGHRHVIMSHYPIPFFRADYNDDFWMLYGHVHTTREYSYLEQLRSSMKKLYVPNEGRPCGNFINVGCMMPWINYTPRTLDEIIEGDRAYYSQSEE